MVCWFSSLSESEGWSTGLRANRLQIGLMEPKYSIIEAQQKLKAASEG